MIESRKFLNPVGLQVEAVEFVKPGKVTCEDFVKWVCANGGTASHNGDELFVATDSGRTEASRGDWIVKGPNGEFWIRKAGLFTANHKEIS